MKEEGTALPTADKLFDMAYEEVVADAMSSMLTDPEVYDKIIELKQQDKTAWERLGEAIKHLITRLRTLLADLAGVPLATAEQRETARFAKETYTQLQDLYAKAFVKADANVAAYEKTTVQDGGERYSVRKIVGNSGTKYGIGVKLDSTLLESLSDSERIAMVKLRVVKELAGTSVIAYDGKGNLVEINFAKKNDKIKHESGKKKPVLEELYRKNIHKKIKQEAVVLADELIETSKYQSTNPATHQHEWLDDYGRNSWDQRMVYIQDKNNAVWKATLHIAHASDGRNILYDIDPIKMVEGPGKSGPTTTTNSIPPNPPDVNTSGEKNSFAGREMEDVSIPEEEQERYERPVEKELRMLSEKYGVECGSVTALADVRC